MNTWLLPFVFGNYDWGGGAAPPNWKFWLGGVAECSRAFLEHFNFCIFTAKEKYEILSEVRTHYEHVTFAIRFWKLWLGGGAECSKAFLEHFNVCVFTCEV